MSDYNRNDYQSKNIIVAGLWQTRNGHYHTMPVDAKAHDALQKVFELGGKFLIRKRTAESIQGARDPEKAPVAFLEFVPKAEVEAFNAKKQGPPPQSDKVGL